MRSLFSLKILIYNRCITGLMPNLIKKSWTVFNSLSSEVQNQNEHLPSSLGQKSWKFLFLEANHSPKHVLNYESDCGLLPRKSKSNFPDLQMMAMQTSNFCPIHVVTFTLISILVTDYIQKRRGQALLFSFEYNLSPNLISK